MESLLRSARRILRSHPAPALPFRQLHRLIALERAGPPPDPDLLLERMRTRPASFRIVDPWRGAWSPLTAPAASRAAAAYRRRLARRGPALDVWVLSASEEAEAESGRDRPLARLRETIRWLGRSVDAGSPTALARWLGLVGRDRRLRRRFGCAPRA